MVAMSTRPVIGIVTNLENDAHYLFPGYPRAMLNEDYHRSVIAAGSVPVLIPPTPDVTTLPQQLALVDGLLLAGGQDVDPLRYGESPVVECGPPSPVRDAFEFAALDLALAGGLPVFGICRGLQLLNVHQGGTLHQDNTHAGTRLRHAGTAEPEAAAHPVEIVPGSFLAEALGRTSALVNSFHHQSIRRLAPGLDAVATAPDGLVEAVWLARTREGRTPSAPVAAVQWHPEMMSRTDPDSQALFRWFVRVCG